MDDTAPKGTTRETKPQQAGHPAAPAAEPKGYRGLTLKQAARTTPCPTVIDTNGDGKITPDDRKIIGYADPDFYGGLSNTFAYGPFTLDAFVNFCTGAAC